MGYGLRRCVHDQPGNLCGTDKQQNKTKKKFLPRGTTIFKLMYKVI